MSQVEVPEEIEHLDFEPEKDPEKEERHYSHPTITDLTWCGCKSREDSKRFTSKNGSSVYGDITCTKCKKLFEAFGGDWFWRTHRKHFNSNCTVQNDVIYHDCGA